MVPIRLEAPVTATTRVRSVSRPAIVSGASSPVPGSKSAHLTLRADGFGRDHPGTDVRVVVQPRDDHLVARSPLLGHGARQVEGQLRHAAAEHDPAGIGAQQVGREQNARRRTASSAFRSAAVSEPRFASGPVSVA